MKEGGGEGCNLRLRLAQVAQQLVHAGLSLSKGWTTISLVRAYYFSEGFGLPEADEFLGSVPKVK